MCPCLDEATLHAVKEQFVHLADGAAFDIALAASPSGFFCQLYHCARSRNGVVVLGCVCCMSAWPDKLVWSTLAFVLYCPAMVVHRGELMAMLTCVV